MTSRRSRPTRKGALKGSKDSASNQRGFWQRLLPLDWSLWPTEARLLLSLTAIWCVAGLLVLASASWWVAAREQGEGAYYLKRQLVWMVASWSLMAFVASTTLRRLLKIAGPGLWIGCLIVGATLVMGTTVNGASRWLVIGPIQVQPSELVKPFVVLQAANLFAHWKRNALDQKLLWQASFEIGRAHV